MINKRPFPGVFLFLLPDEKTTVQSFGKNE